MTHTAILFDLDGTLLDTLEDLADSMNAALHSLGLPTHGREAYRIFVGDGVENLVKRAIPSSHLGDADLIRDAVRRMREEYGRRWHEKTRPYQGITTLLDAAGALGVKCAILSNKPHPATVEVVAHFFPTYRFAAVLGARPGVPIKPDAGAALEVATTLGMEPARFLYLGDTNTDMLTAVAAGMDPVGVLWGFRDAKELTEAGARVLAGHPREILPLL
jgi:phosphoglycolate phosphatase